MTRQEFVNLLDELLPLEPNRTMFLTTYDGRFPRVRPMSLVRDGLRFYIGTGRNDAKSGHMRAHPQVEFVVLLPRGTDTGYLRVAGIAVEVKGKDMHDAWAQGKGYDVTAYAPGGLDNPGIVVFRIAPSRVRLNVPGTMGEEELPLDWFA